MTRTVRRLVLATLAGVAALVAASIAAEWWSRRYDPDARLEGPRYVPPDPGRIRRY